MLELKRRGGTRGVIVSGCLAERQKEELLENRPGDRSSGRRVRPRRGDEGCRPAGRPARRAAERVSARRPTQPLSDRQRLRITPRHFAYLKISEGCDRLCTFCAIPKMRGKHATKPMEEVIAEAERTGGRWRARADHRRPGHDLLRHGSIRRAAAGGVAASSLEEVEGIDWIRLMYLYPMYFTDELIDVIAASERIMPYLDMPLQHINDAMLRRMQRRVNRDGY